MSKSMSIVLILTTMFLLGISSSACSQALSSKIGFLKFKYFQGDEKIKKKEFNSLLENYPASSDHFNKSKKHYNKALYATGITIGFEAWYIYEWTKTDNQNLTAPLIGALTSSAISLFYVIKFGKSLKASLNIYNKQFDDSKVYVSPAENGLGFALHF